MALHPVHSTKTSLATADTVPDKEDEAPACFIEQLSWAEDPYAILGYGLELDLSGEGVSRLRAIHSHCDTIR